jgi:acyl-CoA reductase-like NAD-dependent aldehyde dehydrogenase
MVLKPAEQTPLSALAISALGEEAGLPPGVLSIVTTDAEGAPAIVTELTSNPIIRKLGFTGSTAFDWIKESGIGRYGSHQGIDKYLEVKYMCLRGIDR